MVCSLLIQGFMQSKARLRMGLSIFEVIQRLKLLLDHVCGKSIFKMAVTFSRDCLPNYVAT